MRVVRDGVPGQGDTVEPRAAPESTEVLDIVVGDMQLPQPRLPHETVERSQEIVVKVNGDHVFVPTKALERGQGHLAECQRVEPWKDWHVLHHLFRMLPQGPPSSGTGSQRE